MVAKSENMRNTTGTNDGLAYHNGRAFSTTDRDQDEFDGGNCAAATGGGGGWWYNSCIVLNLNGKMTTSGFFNSHQMFWGDGTLAGNMKLSSSEMRMFRVG